MPPKKRGRAAAAGSSGRAPKRAKVESSSSKGRAATTVSSSGRPKRTTILENPPVYNFTARRQTPKQPIRIGCTRKSLTHVAGSDAETRRSARSAERANAAPASRGRRRPRNKTPSPAPVSAKGKRQSHKSTALVEMTASPKQNGIGSIDLEAKSSQKSESKDQIDAEDDFEEDGTQYWLMKAEPESRLENGVDVAFSIDMLRDSKEPEPWDGVRNFVARNNMRAMKRGDLAFFYHSNCKKPGIVGIMEIVQEHSVDESAFDPKHPYYDPKSSRDKPKWELVHVKFVRKFAEQVSLPRLRSFAKPGGILENMQVLVQSRLSVSSVKPKEWKFILSLVEDDDRDGQEEAHEVPGNTDESAPDNNATRASQTVK